MRVKSYMNNTRNLQKRKFKKTQRKYNARSNQFGGVGPEDSTDTENEKDAEYLKITTDFEARTAERKKIDDCNNKVKDLQDIFIERVERMEKDFIRQSAVIRDNCDNPKRGWFGFNGGLTRKKKSKRKPRKSKIN